MSTNHHTAIAANASAVNTTFNTPLGALDAKLTHAVQSYSDAGDNSTTVTTAATYYAVTSFEVSFTPAYTGQVFLVSMVVGVAYSGTAGASTYNLRIVDSTNTTVVDYFIVGRSTGATGANNGSSVAGVRAWTAASGDVGVTRKAKLYVTHTVNGSVVHTSQNVLQSVTH